MRIAVTGTHGTGKTTLVEDFAAASGRHEVVPEPWLISGADMPFIDGPTSADLEEQLRQSCALILETAARPDLVFDRCPLDCLAYLDVVSADEGFEWVPDGRLLARIAGALQTLDLVVFVPLSRPDEIPGPIEYPRLRRRVDARLRAMLSDDDAGLLEDGLPVLAVSGPRDRRTRRLLAELR
jgi:hypothetical protein